MNYPSLAKAKLAAMAGRNEEAARLIREAAAADDPDALFMLGEMTWRGGLVEQDCQIGRAYYERAAGRGHKLAGNSILPICWPAELPDSATGRRLSAGLRRKRPAMPFDEKH